MINNFYYINLSHRTDRNKNIQHIAKSLTNPTSLPIKIQRVEAVNGRELDIQNISSDILTDRGKADAINNKQKVYVPLTRGGVGCALSHKNTYHKIISDGVEAGLILEDDIHIKHLDKFIKKLNYLVSMAPKDFDILYLGYHDTSIKHIYNQVNDFYSKSNFVYGLFGYVVTNKGAQKLLRIFPISEQIDTEISYNFAKPSNNKNNQIIAYLVNPNERIIFSDQSSTTTEFGTDIQIREAEHIETMDGVAESWLSPIYIVAICIIIYLLFLSIKTKCFFKNFCYK